MARVLDVPFSALGDMTKKQPLNLSVLNLGAPSAGNSVNYQQARRFMEVTKTTGRPQGYRAPVVDRRPEHTVRDVAFAKWENISLQPGLTLDQCLRKVLQVNSEGVGGGKNQLLKIKVKFTDGSDICFARDSPSNPSTLKYVSYYSPNQAFDFTTGKKSVGGGGIGPNGLTSASVLNQKKTLASIKNLGIEFPDTAVRKAMFKRLDPNGNGLLSLAELDKGIMELWPQFNNKPAIMRAYKAADINGTGWIGKSEFDFFLKYLVNYNKVWSSFSTMDTSGDRRVTLEEYLPYMKRVDPKRSEDELRRRFELIDSNGGGFLLFDEFCDHVARKKTDLQLRPDRAQIDAFHEQMAKEKAEKKRKATAASNASVASGSSVYSRAQPFEIPDAETRKALFRRFDPNGNGLLSLAELDKAIIELWPRFNNKPAMLRAYKAADLNGTGFIGKAEFEYFLRYLVHYTNLFNVFMQTDSNSDRRINLQEFLAAASRLNIGQTEVEARQAFVEMDRNHGGYVLFDEFCQWMAKHKTEYEMPNVPKRKAKTTPALKSKATPTPPVRTPPPKKFQMIEVPDAKSRKALFNRMDPNGNGHLSLAELDKAIIELYPQFNNKPALMRAYKAADTSKNGWIGRSEFEFFLRFLVQYNNLFAQFQYVDSSNDRRITRKEFLDAAAVIGLNSLSDSQLSQLFDEMDRNNGGYVLFDEFCTAMSTAKANEEMNANL